MQSYDAGPTQTPILEETTGANFERMVANNPDAEALVDVAGHRRWSYAELNQEIDASSTIPTSPAQTSRRCAPASWPDRCARST